MKQNSTISENSIFNVTAENLVKKYDRFRRLRPNETLKGFIVRTLKRQEPAPQKGAITALKGISFKVKKGQMVGFIGSNGSGKSTLLKLITGICKPSSGQINITGRVSALIELGAGFHPEISGRENIFINGIMLGLTRREIENKFDAIVDFTGLWDYIDNPVRTYSSGMYMRLGFSVAVHVDPDILLIDEVLSVGDESFVHKCLEKIQQFKNEGKTIILVTHDLGAVQRMCDKAYWLEKGELKASGWPRRICDAYLQYVAQKEEERYSQLQNGSSPGLALEMPETVEVSSDQRVPESMSETSKKPERWGSREIEITKVIMLDKHLKERHVFQCGDAVTVSMDFKAHKPIKEVAFGIGVFNQEGVCCYGTNTDIDRYTLDVEKGEGQVRFEIQSLDLVEGVYMLDVATHTVDGYPFDYQRRHYKLTVRSNIKDTGISRINHTWSFSGKCTALKLSAGDSEKI